MKLSEFKLVGNECSNEATRDRIREFNRTATEYPRDKTIHAIFSERANATPDAVAVRDGGVSLTYRQLDQRSNQLARLLLNSGFEAGSFAGVMFAQTSQLLVAVLGVLKAGGAYLPINHDFPAERIRFELDDSQAPVLISEKRFMRVLNQLQWDCRRIKQLIVLDSRDIHAEPEEGGELMQQPLWDAVAVETFDDISGGGWRSSYTGEWLSREVMDDYADNIASKLGPYLSSKTRILEVGCGSGISLFRLAPQAGYYCGTDLSPGILHLLRKEIERRGFDNTRLEACAAHEIDKLREDPFDVVVFNSVIQCFRGHNYLREVLRKCLDLLKHDGLIFLGNIWDNDRKEEFIESLRKFKAENSGPGFRTKIDRSAELFLSEAFLADLRLDFTEIKQIECSRSRGRVKSELSEFGFDALARVNKSHRGKPSSPKAKQQLDGRHVDAFPFDTLENHATAMSPAYLMYTSGTKGRPKGVTIPHRAVVRLVANTTFLQLGPSNRLLQTASIAFDASTFEIWAPLLNGGCLCSMPERAMLDPVEIGRHVRDLGITTMWLTASLFNQLVEVDHAFLAGLKHLLIGGERLSTRHVNLVCEKYPELVLINGYGPTENTTFSTCFRIVKTYAADIPIGPPISNSQVHVLDASNQLAPIGVVGEICVGGDGLALGYWNDPVLTASKFVPHPDDPRERIYRSGDLGRWLPCGNLEYHGRRDDQLKIRGFRVEPGEVETAIYEFPGVHECAVIGEQTQDNANYLVAYLVTRNGEISIDALRDSLQAKLPHYMVPAHILTLPRFPLTPNGKLDHRALPKPAATNDRGQRTIAPPTCEKERLLVETWKAVLGIDQIGIHDNFFELGGDSILTIKIIARARQQGLSFTPSQMFARQTIAELAAMATATQTDPLTDTAVGPAPLTPIQHWFFARQLPAPRHFNQAIICETQQDLEPDLVMQVMRALTNHHDALRLRFDEGATWRQTVSDGEELVPFLMRDLSNQPPAEQAVAFRAGVEELQRSLDLSSGPLLRVVLWRFGGARRDLLLWIIHHLAVDAVSWQILLNDFQSAYQQVSAGHRLALPAKTTSFRTWANRLESYAQSTELDAEVDYWTADCRRRVGRLPIEGLGNHDDNLVSSAAQVEVELPAEQTEMLLRVVPRVYHTKIDEVLLTALARCIANWTGDNSLLVAVEGHGREGILADLDLTRTVGWFTSIFPVHLQLAEGQTRGEAVKSVKEQLRRIPNHGIGYGVLRYLRGDGQLVERLESLPQPEVAFNYLGQLDGVFDEGALLRAADEDVGENQHPEGRRACPVEINSCVADGRLRFSWTYSANLHRRATIERVAREVISELRELIAHCVSPEAGGYTPSDFPDVQLGCEDLDQILTEVAAENDVNCLRGQGIDAICPLTPSQRGMLVSSLAAPESGQYIEQFVLDLQGEFEPSLFVGPVQELVDRHAILRTAFVWRAPPCPLQVVLEHATAPVREHDLTELPEEEASARMAAFLRTDRMRGFQLTKAPALRMTIFRLPQKRLRLVITLHHIVIDGWSMAILEDELTRLMRARLHGEPAQLERPLPFGEYTRWLGKQDLQAAESFWRLELKEFRKPTDLGRVVDASDASPSPNRFRQREVKLGQAATAELTDLVKRQQCTQNTLVQGVWGLLLGRYAAQSDVTFGVTVSGRPSELPGVERSVGFFNNTVPMRIDISPDADLWEWLREIQKQRGRASRFDFASGGQIQQWSEMALTEPLFESVIVFENYPVKASSDAGEEIDLGVSGSAFEGAQTQYALTVLVVPYSQLKINIVYDAWRWEDSQVELILDQFSSLLQFILESSEPKIRTVLETLADRPIPRVMRRRGKPEAGLSESYLAPRDDLESSLAVIWADVLGMERVGVRSNFFDLGGHSLAGVILLARIHDSLGMRLPLASLIGGNTIERMARMISNGENDPYDSYLVPLQTEGTRPPLFCVHPAGGSALCYRDLAMGLGPDQPFYGIQSIGPNHDFTDFQTLEGTAAIYIDAIRSIQPRGPYLLAGWSFGAFCAYEMARQFEQQGEAVAFTGLLDIPPELASNEADQDLDYGDLLEELVVDEGVQLSMDYLRQLGPDEQLLYVLQRAKQSNVIAPDSSESQLRELLHGLKVHRQAISNYRLQPYGGRIVHLRASQGPSAEMDCSRWDELAAGGVETIWVPGSHANMVLPPHVQELSERIKDCLDQVYRRNPKNNRRTRACDRSINGDKN